MYHVTIAHAVRKFNMNILVKSIAAIAVAASLAGCAATGSITPNQVTVSTDSFVNQVISKTKQVCQFVPTGTTVANLIGSLTGYGAITMTVSDVAGKICSVANTVVTGPKLSVSRMRATNPTASLYIDGVLVEGTFIR